MTEFANAVDCDVHCAPSSLAALAPYLDEYWREYISNSGAHISGLATAYPPGSPLSPAPAPSSYAALSEYLEQSRPRTVILNCITPFETHRNPYYSAAVASAVNDWVTEEFLDRDPRLRASLLVSPYDAEGAVAEIERRAGDRRFVQVLLPVRGDGLYGNRRYHPILEAVARHDLTLGLHAWGSPAHAPTPTGYTSTYLQDYVSNAQLAQTQVLSLVSEGVFARLPQLRVVLLESGFSWLPPLLWRFDKDWKSVWREVPWVKEKPSEYVKRHFRATTQPAHLPSDRRQVAELVEMVGSERLLYASDHPHHHGPGAEPLFEVLDGPAAEAVLGGNAEAFYRL